jgi:hypothetical protein
MGGRAIHEISPSLPVFFFGLYGGNLGPNQSSLRAGCQQSLYSPMSCVAPF